MPYDLWRLDDNGQRFLVATFPDREDAERRMAELTRSLHKQTYWVAPRPFGGDTGRPDPSQENR